MQPGFMHTDVDGSTWIHYSATPIYQAQSPFVPTLLPPFSVSTCNALPEIRGGLLRSVRSGEVDDSRCLRVEPWIPASRPRPRPPMFRRR